MRSDAYRRPTRTSLFHETSPRYDFLLDVGIVVSENKLIMARPAQHSGRSQEKNPPVVRLLLLYCSFTATAVVGVVHTVAARCLVYLRKCGWKLNIVLPRP